jgi:tetratricopeptide (TPR) repeat protein
MRNTVGGADDAAFKESLKNPHMWLDSVSKDAGGFDRTEDDAISLLAELGMAQCNAGDKAAALATADQLLTGAAKAPSPNCGVGDRLAAASIRIAAGKGDQAKVILDPLEKEMIRLIPSPDSVTIKAAGAIDENWAMENIAVQYVRLGDFDHARKLVEQIDVYDLRAEARCNLAHEMFIHNRKNDAKQLLELSNKQVNDPKYESDQSFIYQKISEELASEGSYDAAFKFAAAIPEPYHRHQAMAGIVAAQFRAGDAVGSHKIAERAWKTFDAAPVKERGGDFVYLAANQLLEARDTKGAELTLQHIAGALPAFSSQEHVAYLFLEAAIAASAGDEAGCTKQVAAAATIQLPANARKNCEESGWSQIARAYSHAGKFDQAISALEKSGFTYEYDGIAMDMVKKGLFDRALATLAKESPTLNPFVAERFSREAVQHCDVAAVYRWMQSIKDANIRARAAIGASEGLAQGRDDLGISNRPVMVGIGG